MVWGASTARSLYNGAASAVTNTAWGIGEAAKWGTYIGTGTLYYPWEKTAAESVAPTDAQKTQAHTTATEAKKSGVRPAGTDAGTTARRPRHRGPAERRLTFRRNRRSGEESEDTDASEEDFESYLDESDADTAEDLLAADTQAAEAAATRGYLSYLAAPFTTAARCVAWPFKTTYKAASAVARTGWGVASTALGAAGNRLSYFVPETVKSGFRSWMPTYGGEVVNGTLVNGTTVNPAETVKADQTVPRTRRSRSGTEAGPRRRSRTRGSRSSSPDATDKGTVPRPRQRRHKYLQTHTVPETERKEASPAPRATSSAHDVDRESLQNSSTLLTEVAEGDFFRRRVSPETTKPAANLSTQKLWRRGPGIYGTDLPQSTLVAARA